MGTAILTRSARGSITATRLLTLIKFVITSLVCDAAFADTKTWNVPSGSWTVSQNWSPQGVPLAGDDVEFTNGGVAQLLGGSSQARSVRIGPFNQTGGTGTIEISGLNTSLTTQSAFIGENDTSAGLIRVSDSAKWINNATISLGYLGSGRLEVLNNSELSRLFENHLFFEDSFILGDQPGSEGDLPLTVKRPD